MLRVCDTSNSSAVSRNLLVMVACNFFATLSALDPDPYVSSSRTHAT